MQIILCPIRTQKGEKKTLETEEKNLYMLCGLMLAVSSPTYAENATEAVSISDTASVVELTSDANMETEMQSVSDSDTTETSALETDQVAFQQSGRKLIHILQTT